jgi:dTDP-4-dehydrorhamnose reductase
VLSAGRRNFLDTMLRLAGERDEVRVVADQHGCPTSAEDVAEALLAVVDRLGERGGTWHLVNAGEASWHELAGHIFDRAAGHGWRVPRLTAITTAEYPTPARRPANSRLATDLIRRDFGIALRPWREAVDALLATRLAEAG